ncbi:MAG TPA: hypothetical protein VLX61_02510 [Anaerolineales bacterium]|nr:hypothetical protein [Anaerolineales bacterium]
MKRSFVFIILSCIFASCAPKPNPDVQLQLDVAQTVAAIPTYTPFPTPRIAPTLTPMSLSGLFCEYQFCIGHPVDIVFFDANAVNVQYNPAALSSVSEGKLAAYDPSLIIQLIWQDATGATDASFLFNTLIDSKLDSRSGDLQAFQMDGMDIDYIPIMTAASPSLPYGGAAAWLCGGRAFAWKAYTPEAEIAVNLLNEALERFRCNPK